jgi:hypothetical protein
MQKQILRLPPPNLPQRANSLFGAPGTFGAPFAQNDSVFDWRSALRRTLPTKADSSLTTPKLKCVRGPLRSGRHLPGAGCYEFAVIA